MFISHLTCLFMRQSLTPFRRGLDPWISFPPHPTPCRSSPAGVNFVTLAGVSHNFPILFLTRGCFDLFCFSGENWNQPGSADRPRAVISNQLMLSLIKGARWRGRLRHHCPAVAVPASSPLPEPLCRWLDVSGLINTVHLHILDCLLISCFKARYVWILTVALGRASQK